MAKKKAETQEVKKEVKEVKKQRVKREAKFQMVNRPELIDETWERIPGITKKDLTVVVRALFETMESLVLEEGKELSLGKLGKLRRHIRAPRLGRNPKTGDPLQIGEKVSVKLRQSVATKKQLNEVHTANLEKTTGKSNKTVKLTETSNAVKDSDQHQFESMNLE